MAIFSEHPIRTLDDLKRFESERTLEQRLTERSVLDVFIGAAARQPERTAMTMLMTGAPDEQPRRVNYAELLGMVRRSANLFHSLGGPRPGVAYMLPSLIETHATLWGAETVGYAVPINFLLQVEHIAALLEASGARILVALGPHPVLDIWQKALAVRERVPGLTLVRVAPPTAPAEQGVIDFHAAMAAQPEDHLIFGEPGKDDDVAAYFHTGGTTGTPKLVAHTHRGQLTAAFGGAAIGDYRADDVLTGTFPLFHVAGTIACGLAAFLAGMELLVMSPGGLRTPAMVQGFWRLVGQYKATLVGGVPTSMGAVLEVPLDGADISAVRAGITGAALLPPAVSERFRQVTGCNLYEVYGMTEASGLIAYDPFAGAGAAGSVGWALPYTKVEVRRLGADGQLGEECEAGEVGVISVRGAHVSPGYRNPAHNAGIFDNGMLNTGDLGYTDEQGRLYIAGRSKDLIIRSGHNIDPVMIENAMAEHPAVALAAAVGMPDAYAGELPVCFVTLRPGAEVSDEELHAHAQQRIGERPAWPKHFHIIEAIPVTSVGKIFKPELRCDAAARLVGSVLREQHQLPDAQVQVSAGGPRGLIVTVTVPVTAEATLPAITKTLAAYLFEARVAVA
ncbi:acyl-CoA synthetase [Hydrogenophaga crassostreae]|uniref:Acyl-CoA synthetase n=1 Tax=Hydrogenophaga crassostreae TaxID=1763535 RepID=A0A167H4M0_9BURK|nr:acyl-CoA synthetase [Hydrogenophaga crassostreae]AOW15483.1 acyl-CoA synthetase [Hydrogenophaga crassostreae]OAD40270.1 acyl-CoA synthetase [Hydrogenophaga crassostreae]